MTDLDAHPEDSAALALAVDLLEAPSLTIQLANLVGTPIEWGVSRLPRGMQSKVHGLVRTALGKAVSMALKTMDDAPQRPASTRLHKAATAATGAVGGFFGMSALALELPVTTTLIMRAIADVARSEGCVLSDPEVQAACIEVFALGGNAPDDDAADSGYYASRSALAEVVRLTTKDLVGIAGQRAGERALTGAGSTQISTWLARLIDAAAARFGVVVTEKMAAQIVPVVGAASGAAINALFTHYYQNMARGHFIVRRLESRYGEAAVRQAYQALATRRRARVR